MLESATLCPKAFPEYHSKSCVHISGGHLEKRFASQLQNDTVRSFADGNACDEVCSERETAGRWFPTAQEGEECLVAACCCGMQHQTELLAFVRFQRNQIDFYEIMLIYIES